MFEACEDPSAVRRTSRGCRSFSTCSRSSCRRVDFKFDDNSASQRHSVIEHNRKAPSPFAHFEDLRRHQISLTLVAISLLFISSCHAVPRQAFTETVSGKFGALASRKIPFLPLTNPIQPPRLTRPSFAGILCNFIITKYLKLHLCAPSDAPRMLLPMISGPKKTSIILQSYCQCL